MKSLAALLVLIKQYHLYHKGASDWCIQAFFPVKKVDLSAPWWTTLIKTYTSTVWRYFQGHGQKKNYDWGNVHSKILLDIYQCFLPLIKERTQKKIWLRHTSYGLAQLKTKGILGEIPCLHSAKCHLWLQVRGKKIQPSCVFGLDRSGMKY